VNQQVVKCINRSSATSLDLNTTHDLVLCLLQETKTDQRIPMIHSKRTLPEFSGIDNIVTLLFILSVKFQLGGSVCLFVCSSVCLSVCLSVLCIDCRQHTKQVHRRQY